VHLSKQQRLLLIDSGKQLCKKTKKSKKNVVLKALENLKLAVLKY
jgi:hypothetical protein